MTTGDEPQSRLAATAGRLAFFPARIAARASRDQLASTPDDVLVRELVGLIDRAFATTLPEEVVQSAVRHQVVDRVVAELVASGALDRAVEGVIRSDQMHRVIKEVVESAEVRTAMTDQATGFAEEVVGGVRRRAVRLDDRADRRQRGARSPFAGVATRALALAFDAALILVGVLSLTALLALISSLVGTLRPQWLVAVLLGSGWALIAATYFVLFWSSAGQTPGMRLLRLRLQGRNGTPPSLGRAILRVLGTAIAIIPLFAGYLPVLFDDRRRGLPDFLAGTVVVYEDPKPA
jgi:uncharacterized RDD family membrane protein YckC